MLTTHVPVAPDVTVAIAAPPGPLMTEPGPSVPAPFAGAAWMAAAPEGPPVATPVAPPELPVMQMTVSAADTLRM